MSAHRVLKDFFRAYENIGPGIGVDPGNAGTINPEMWGQQFLIKTAGAETRTLARPDRPGILTSIVLDTDGGDLTLTVTGSYNTAGDTTIVFNTAGDMVVFMSVKTGTTYEWTAIAQEGTNIEAGGDQTQAITAAGAVTVDGTVNRATLAGGAYAITLAAPSAAMRGKTLVIEYIGGDTDAVTLSVGSTIQGNSAGSTYTFNADNETLVLVGGQAKWNVVKEVGVTIA